MMDSSAVIFHHLTKHIRSLIHQECTLSKNFPAQQPSAAGSTPALSSKCMYIVCQLDLSLWHVWQRSEFLCVRKVGLFVVSDSGDSWCRTLETKDVFHIEVSEYGSINPLVINRSAGTWRSLHEQRGIHHSDMVKRYVLVRWTTSFLWTKTNYSGGISSLCSSAI